MYEFIKTFSKISLTAKQVMYDSFVQTSHRQSILRVYFFKSISRSSHWGKGTLMRSVPAWAQTLLSKFKAVLCQIGSDLFHNHLSFSLFFLYLTLYRTLAFLHEVIPTDWALVCMFAFRSG